jgi:hypothetical protein
MRTRAGVWQACFAFLGGAGCLSFFGLWERSAVSRLRIGHCKLVICHLLGVGVTPKELSERLWPFAARIAKVVDALR